MLAASTVLGIARPCRCCRPCTRAPSKPCSSSSLFCVAISQAKLSFICAFKPPMLRQEGIDAIFAAVKLNAAVLVEFLLQNGGQINCRDDAGSTPLHLAIQLQHVEVVKVEYLYSVDIS